MGEGFINSWSFLPAPAHPLASINQTTAVWAVGFFFGNTELSLEIWNVIVGLSGFDEWLFRMPSNRGRLNSFTFETL
jgi:hypothetical protein